MALATSRARITVISLVAADAAPMHQCGPPPDRMNSWREFAVVPLPGGSQRSETEFNWLGPVSAGEPVGDVGAEDQQASARDTCPSNREVRGTLRVAEITPGSTGAASREQLR